MKHNEMEERMKTYYEQIFNYKLMRRVPVVIRIDGRAFHTFTRGFRKPFDPLLMETMQRTMKYLCRNIQGCVFGYTQSDEISLVLIDYKTLKSSAWFDYRIEKICSNSAAMATLEFNRVFARLVDEYSKSKDVDEKVLSSYRKALKCGAIFDSRTFNIPQSEVANYIYSRQSDASRNSVQALGQSEFSHSDLQNKSSSDIQDMLHEQKDINWNDYPIPCKRGSACHKNDEGKWFVDLEMPIIRKTEEVDYRQYVEKWVYPSEENTDMQTNTPPHGSEN